MLSYQGIFFEAMIREVKEESGINLSRDKLYFYKTKYVECEEYHFLYPMFSYKLDKLSEIKIDSTCHQEYIWEYPEKCFELELIQDLDSCMLHYYKIDNKVSDILC